MASHGFQSIEEIDEIEGLIDYDIPDTHVRDEPSINDLEKHLIHRKRHISSTLSMLYEMILALANTMRIRLRPQVQFLGVNLCAIKRASRN
ncbi:hypothetical protein RJ639_025141 [Escallonia herrerae]|uniref:Uncharacterized protein n=1 Tax=Escallonia herrerae TaxID=1293975 RepID=A0AA88RU93_9ASTE|nr:hypothetical protein RJ639_025141 [Escallonia herrerae]